MYAVNCMIKSKNFLRSDEGSVLRGPSKPGLSSAHQLSVASGAVVLVPVKESVIMLRMCLNLSIVIDSVLPRCEMQRTVDEYVLCRESSKFIMASSKKRNLYGPTRRVRI